MTRDPTTVRFSDDEQAMIDSLKACYALDSASQVIRLAIRRTYQQAQREQAAERQQQPAASTAGEGEG